MKLAENAAMPSSYKNKTSYGIFTLWEYFSTWIFKDNHIKLCWKDLTFLKKKKTTANVGISTASDNNLDPKKYFSSKLLWCCFYFPHILLINKFL